MFSFLNLEKIIMTNRREHFVDIRQIIASILESKKETGGITEIVFSACGGSLGAFYPAKTMIEMEARNLKTGFYNANEFCHSVPSWFGKNTLMVVASHRGNTPETVRSAKIAHEAGAAVIALTYFPDTPICEYADYVVPYSFGEEKDIAEEKVIQALKIAAELLNQTEGYEAYDAFCDGVSKIDQIVKSACRQVQKRAQAFAEEYKNDEFIYTMGSGAAYCAAYMESICIFMEMQWINSAAIHSGEYFHGPFEVTDANRPFVVQLSEGKTRELDERALTFLKKYAKRYEVLDAKELGLSIIDSRVVDYFNHSLFNNVYGVYNAALAQARQHPLSVRRYMWKVEY